MEYDVLFRIIGGKRVYEVEDHHHVLIPWTEERKRLGQPLHVLTLDHHTDTLPVYTHYHETHPGEQHRIQYDFDSIADALEDMRHDEHFDFAVKNKILRSAAIFSHVNFAVDVNPAVKIIHTPPEEGQEAAYYARTLETDFLNENLQAAPVSKPYILDIDLDVFKGEKSIHPDDPSCFYTLIQEAEAITVCRERDWVRLLNLDYGRLQYEYFLEQLYTHIELSIKA